MWLEKLYSKYTWERILVTASQATNTYVPRIWVVIHFMFGLFVLCLNDSAVWKTGYFLLFQKLQWYIGLFLFSHVVVLSPIYVWFSLTSWVASPLSSSQFCRKTYVFHDVTIETSFLNRISCEVIENLVLSSLHHSVIKIHSSVRFWKLYDFFSGINLFTFKIISFYLQIWMFTKTKTP